MTLIAPNIHLKSTPITITIVSIVGNKIKIGIQDSINNYFPGQELTVSFAGNLAIKGNLLITDTNETFLNVTVPSTLPTLPATGTILNTFNVTADNETVTPKDIRLNLIGTSDVYENEKLNKKLVTKGTPGLLVGSDIFKIKKLTNLIPHPTTLNFKNSLLNYQIIGIINIVETGPVTEHIINLTGNGFNGEFALSISNNFITTGDESIYPFSLKRNHFSIKNSFDTTGDNVDIKFKIERCNVASGPDYLLISAKFNGFVNDPVAEEIYVFHKVSDPVNVLSTAPTKTTGYQLNTGGFEFKKHTIGYTNNGEIFSGNLGTSRIRTKNIPVNSSLNQYTTPGYFHNYDTVVLTNFPVTTSYPSRNKFNLEVSELHNASDGTRQILQRYNSFVIVDNKYVPLTFERVSVGISQLPVSWGEWYEVGLKIHKHVPTDINETEEKQFISKLLKDALIELLNQNGNLLWLAPVGLFSELDTVDVLAGQTHLVIESGIIYSYINNVWTPISANSITVATATKNGLITKEQFVLINNLIEKISIDENNNLVTNGIVIPNASSNDIVMADGSILNKTTLAGFIQSIATHQYIYVKPGNQTFNLDWSLYSEKFGNYGNFKILMKTGRNKYALENVPISVTIKHTHKVLSLTIPQLIISDTINTGNGNLTIFWGQIINQKNYQIQVKNLTTGIFNATKPLIAKTTAIKQTSNFVVTIPELVTGIIFRIKSTNVNNEVVYSPEYSLDINGIYDIAYSETVDKENLNMVTEAIEYIFTLSNKETIIIIT